MVIVSAIGLSVLSVFFFFVFSRKKKTVSDKWLMTTIVLFACMLISIMLIDNGYSIVKYLFQILVNIYFFPSILIYGLTLINENHRFNKNQWWVPSFAIVFTFYIIIDFSIISDYSDSEKLKLLYESPPLMYQIFYKLQYVFVIGSLWWFIRKVEKYRTTLKRNFSFIDNINLDWLKKFAYAYISIHVLNLFFILLADFAIIKDIKIPFGILFLGVISSLFYLSYKGIRHYALADFKELNDYNKSIENADTSNNFKTKLSLSKKEKYKTSSLTEKEMDFLFEKIMHMFDEDKVYLKPQLRINEIAERLRVNTHKISQTINSKTKKSFYDYVNSYRVEHFKKLLSEPENRKYTILAMGIESGFNSKATLNRIFKETVGVSPKEFQKK